MFYNSNIRVTPNPYKRKKNSNQYLERDKIHVHHNMSTRNTYYISCAIRLHFQYKQDRSLLLQYILQRLQNLYLNPLAPFYIFLPFSILSGTSVVGLNDGDVLFNGVGNAVGEYEGNSVGLDECTFEGLSDGASTHLLFCLLQT